METRNYSILSLAFIASSFKVTEENLVFETVHSSPYFYELIFIFYLNVDARKATLFQCVYNTSRSLVHLLSALLCL